MAAKQIICKMLDFCERQPYKAAALQGSLLFATLPLDLQAISGAAERKAANGLTIYLQKPLFCESRPIERRKAINGLR